MQDSRARWGIADSFAGWEHFHLGSRAVLSGGQEATMPERRGSTVIENVQPQLDGGRYPVARLAGEPVRVTADIFKEGHDDLAAVVRWRQLTPQETEPREEPMRFLGNDARSEEHTSELQSHLNLVCRLLLEKKKRIQQVRDKEIKKKDTANKEK